MKLFGKIFMACLVAVIWTSPGISGVMEPVTFEVAEGFPSLTLTLVEGEVQVAEGAKMVQRIPCDEDAVRMAEEMSMELVSLVDMNFDGFPDLQILESLGSVNAYYACYLWNPEKSLFEKNEALEEIASPRFREDTKEISGFYHGSATDNVETLYAWREGGLTLLWRKTQAYEEDLGRFVITEERLKDDGTLETEFERSFSEEELELYLQGKSGLREEDHRRMEAASEQILGTKISGDPVYHGEALTENKGVTAWLAELENGEMVCFEVSYDGSMLYLNKGGDQGTFRVCFGEKVSLGKRVF
ncbi:MAG TPA: hypothetical protein PLW97_10605 [Synergistaceae bacterium]|nr:hypothetical protein [Synergistaceae bacterium]